MSRNGISSFNKERLQQIIAVRRQTQAQLAAMVGVSTATMSKWVNGQHSPDAKTLERLASVLNVSAEWFTRSMARGIENPLFRNNASAHKQDRVMLEARLNWADDIILGLSTYLPSQPRRLPERSFTTPHEISHLDIEEAATEFRSNMKIGNSPLQDLMMIAECSGVVVVREQTDSPAIEGLSAWSKETGYPLALLSSDNANTFRSRFDLAHELGHLILHKHIDQSIMNQNYNLMEQQAHSFAGALLLPAGGFSGRVRAPITLDDLLIQKQYWGASIPVMIMRLHELNVIDDRTKANLLKRHSARGWVKKEPYDDDFEPEKPSLLRNCIELLLKENIFSVDSLITYFGIGKFDLINLLSLDEDFFGQNKSKIMPFVKVKN